MGSRSPQLIPFEFDGWVFYLISFNPSLLSSLLAGYSRCTGHLSLLYADWHIFWLLNSHQCQSAMSYWSFIGLRGHQNVAEDLDEI